MMLRGVYPEHRNRFFAWVTVRDAELSMTPVKGSAGQMGQGLSPYNTRVLVVTRAGFDVPFNRITRDF
jgi:hypothetical protein